MKQNVPYRVHEISLMAPVLGHMNPIHILTLYYFKNHFIILNILTFRIFVTWQEYNRLWTTWWQGFPVLNLPLISSQM
jgi:hypothetical protein